MAYINPASTPVRIPAKALRAALACQAEGSSAPETSTHPPRQAVTASSMGQPSRSLSSHQPSSAVKAAEQYTSTVATAAPFSETESVQKELKQASISP